LSLHHFHSSRRGQWKALDTEEGEDIRGITTLEVVGTKEVVAMEGIADLVVAHHEVAEETDSPDARLFYSFFHKEWSLFFCCCMYFIDSKLVKCFTYDK
jgi:hypothetical protein